MMQGNRIPMAIAYFDKLLPFLWLLLLLILLILGLFLPLQTDEITWSYANHRAIVDHFEAITTMPQCQSAGDFSKKLPLLWYPHAFVSHFLFMEMENPIWIRIISQARFLLMLVACWFTLKPLAGWMNCKTSQLFFCFTALVCLTPLSLLMQINRPEQPLFTGITIFLALALNAETIARHSIGRWVAFVLFVVTALLCFPAHPKALAVLPLILACAYVLFKHLTKHKWFIWLILLCICGFAFESAAFWLKRYDCYNSESMEQWLHMSRPPIELIAPHPIEFIFSAIHIFFSSIFDSFSLRPALQNGFDWLPNSLTPLPPIGKLLDVILYVISRALGIILTLFCLAFLTCALLRLIQRGFIFFLKGTTYYSRYEYIACLCMITLVGLVIIIGPLQQFYALSLILPLLYLCAIFSICSTVQSSAYIEFWELLNFLSLLLPPLYRTTISRIYTRIESTPGKFWRTMYILLQLCAVSGVLLTAYKYYPYISQPETRERFTKKRAILFSPWLYTQQKQAIEEAYHACNLPPLSSAKHLVLDDFTYPVLNKSYEPFNYHNITNYYFYGSFDLNLMFDVMKRYKSDGIIIDCREVPEELTPYLTEHNGYCCMEGKNIR